MNISPNWQRKPNGREGEGCWGERVMYKLYPHPLENYMPVPEGGCWIWMGGIRTGGYGYVCRNGFDSMAHRVFYAHHKGPIPPGLNVCHKCDVRLCVNPDHLFLGTTAENSADMVQKGRSARGELNGRAKLTPENVLSIVSSPLSLRLLSDKFGVSRTVVDKIRAGRSWKHITQPYLRTLTNSAKADNDGR